MDFLWPLDLPIASQELVYADATEVFPATLTPDVYTVGLGGDRWRMSISTPTLGVTHRTRLQTLLARMRGSANRLWLPDHAYTRDSSAAFSSPELIVNQSFADTSSWSAASGATLAAANGRLRVQKTGSGASSIRHSAVTTVSGAAYVFRALPMMGRGSASIKLKAGTTAGASDLGESSAMTTYEMITLGFVSTAVTTVHLSIEVSTLVADEWCEIGYVTCARCYRLDNSVTSPQTSSAVRLKSSPTSTAGLEIEGAWLEIVGSGLHRLTARLDSDSSGIATAVVYPPTRGANADNAPVIVHAPLLRAVVTGGNLGYQTEPGKFVRAGLEALEDAA